jgi:hypothetical protein
VFRIVVILNQEPPESIFCFNTFYLDSVTISKNWNENGFPIFEQQIITILIHRICLVGIVSHKSKEYTAHFRTNRRKTNSQEMPREFSENSQRILGETYGIS